MNIIYFVESFPALSETFVLNQVQGLIALGHHVRVVALYRDASANHHFFDRYSNAFECHYVYGRPRNRIERILIAAKAAIVCVTKEPRALFHLISLKQKENDLRILEQLCLARTWISAVSKADVIHCHFGPAGRKAAFLKKAGFFSCRLVTTMHAYDIVVVPQIKSGDYYRTLFNESDRILTVCLYMRSKVIELGASEERVSVHRVGVDTQEFSLVERKYLEENRIKLLVVGRVVEKKGIEYAILALAIINKNDGDLAFELTIIGGGAEKYVARLKSVIADLGVDGNVHFYGPKSHDDVKKMMKENHILLVPSVTAINGDQEGTPTVILEALSMGMPVIATNHSGIPEVLEYGIFGTLVPEADPEALAKAILTLSGDTRSWQEIGVRGRRHILDRYDITKLNKRLVIDHLKSPIGDIHVV